MGNRTRETRKGSEEKARATCEALSQNEERERVFQPCSSFSKKNKQRQEEAKPRGIKKPFLVFIASLFSLCFPIPRSVSLSPSALAPSVDLNIYAHSCLPFSFCAYSFCIFIHLYPFFSPTSVFMNDEFCFVASVILTAYV